MEFLNKIIKSSLVRDAATARLYRVVLFNNYKIAISVAPLEAVPRTHYPDFEIVLNCVNFSQKKSGSIEPLFFNL